MTAVIGFIDNFAPNELIETIHRTITDSDFPWFWRSSTRYGIEERGQKDYQFVHNVFYDGKALSTIFPLMEQVIQHFVNKTGIEIANICRIKINLTTPSTLTENELNESIHVDVNEETSKHISIVYYVDDSDGETLVYKDDQILLAQEPAKGSAVYFSSNMRHRHTPPTNNKRRLVINFVLNIA